VIPAAERGFAAGDAYTIGLLFCGIAVIAAIGALSHERERAFSASLVYLALGVGASVTIEAADIPWVDPIEDAELVERIAELAVIVALFGTGLKLDRPLSWGAWSGVLRLLAIAMPLTIAGVALFGGALLGLSFGAAMVLGAILAPTDPVLAGDVGVGPPGDEDEHEPNFSVTGEAGLNDGLALPFLFFGLFALDPGGTSWLGEWLLADVLYAVLAGVAVGAALGWAGAAGAVRLKARRYLVPVFDGWLAIPIVLIIYGTSELIGAYGFVAAFAGGIAFRRYERGHEHNARVHDGAEVVEKFGELAAILLLGSMLTFAGLGEIGIEGWVLIALLLFVLRPAAVGISLLASGLPRQERAFVAWFGVRGIGSLYYVAVALGSGYLAGGDVVLVTWVTLATVVVSIVIHGVTATPLSRRLLPPEAQTPGITQRGG
jgi:NhaP-type Na+/H+ or K+/H+ antiporter